MNMLNNSFFLSLAFFSLLFGKIVAQSMVVTGGTTMTVTTGTTVTLSGMNLQNNATATITHNGTIIMAGNATGRDLINNGTFNGTAGTIQMTGTTEQQVQGSSAVNIGTFTINNGGNGVSVSNTGALRIHNTLNLTNGKLFTANASPVRFTTTANNPTETNTNHIVGTAIMEQRTINAAPFPTFLLFSMAAGADIDNVTLTRRSGNGTATSRGFTPTTGVVNPIGFESIAAHWEVDNSLAGNRTATLSWFPAWDNGKDLTQMQLWRTNAPFTIAQPWVLRTVGTVDMSTRTHTFTSDVLRNAWTVSDIVNPLPVDLLTFDVKLLQGKDVEVTWTSQNEINLKNYVVERSADNRTFESIGSQLAKNQAYNNYKHNDLNAKALGKNVLYYRLVQVDNDGQRRTTHAKPVYFNKAFWAGIYPNPYKDELNVKIYNPEKYNITLTFTDNLGRMHLRTTLTGEEIDFKPSDYLQHLAAGTYFLQLTYENQIEILKVIKQ